MQEAKAELTEPVAWLGRVGGWGGGEEGVEER